MLQCWVLQDQEKQQRVALARALVFEPRLVLMDEPLGALDKNLREQMQYEIKHIHERIGITVVYVTHDQSEALTMSNAFWTFSFVSGFEIFLTSKGKDKFSSTVI